MQIKKTKLNINLGVIISIPVPIVKNTIDKISDIRNLIGVQPMIGPVGLVYPRSITENI
jgi:hypothetical protein